MTLSGISLVTGAGGFIGSHLVETLLRRGLRVRALVRYSSRGTHGFLDDLSPELRRELEIVVGDLKDPDAVRRAVQGTTTVFHLGALIAIPYSYVNPTDVVQTNVIGTTHVLSACRDLAVERVVHTSTSEVYGTARYVPIDEAHPLQGQSPYSASKIGADHLAESYYRAFNLPVTILRPFNTYGPRQSARAIIPTLITQLLTQPVIKVGNLTPRRDLTFVADTVAGFLRAAEVDEAVGRTIHLGTNRDVAIGEVLELLKTITGKTDIPVEVDPARVRPGKSEVDRLLSTYALAEQVLSWRPTVSLEDGLAETVRYIEAHLAQYRPTEYAI